MQVAIENVPESGASCPILAPAVQAGPFEAVPARLARLAVAGSGRRRLWPGRRPRSCASNMKAPWAGPGRGGRADGQRKATRRARLGLNSTVGVQVAFQLEQRRLAGS